MPEPDLAPLESSEAPEEGNNQEPIPDEHQDTEIDEETEEILQEVEVTEEVEVEEEVEEEVKDEEEVEEEIKEEEENGEADQPNDDQLVEEDDHGSQNYEEIGENKQQDQNDDAGIEQGENQPNNDETENPDDPEDEEAVEEEVTETIEETPAEVVDLTSETNAKTKDKATKTKKVTRIVTRKIKKKRQKPAEEKLADNSETKPNIPLICQQFPISGFKRVDEFIADLFLYANSKTISHLLNLRQSPEKIMVGGELILPKTEIARRLNIGVEKLADNEFVKKDTTILNARNLLDVVICTLPLTASQNQILSGKTGKQKKFKSQHFYCSSAVLMQHGKFRQLILENRYRCHKYPQHRPNMYIKIQMPGTFKPVLDKVLYWAHTHELNIKQDKIPQFIACMKYMGLACPAYGELAKLGGFDGGFWPNQNSFDKEVAKQPELAGKKPLRLVEDLKSSPCWKLTREYDFKLHDNQHFSPDTSKKENSKLVGTAEMVPDHIKRKVDNQEKKEQSAKSYNQHWQSVQDQQLAQRHHVPMMPAQSLPIQAGLQAPPRPVQSFEVSSGPPTIPPSFQAAPPSISTGNPPLLNSSPSVSSVPRPGSNQLSNTMAQYQQQQKQDTPDIFAMQQQIQQQQAMLTQLQQNISQPINEPGRKRKSKKEKRREEAFRQREARILSSNPAPMPVSMPPVAAPTSTAIGYGPPTLNFGRPSEAVGFKSFDQVSNQPANDPVPEKRPRTHSAWTDIKDQNVIKSMGWGTVPTSNTWRTNANMESSEKQALPSWGSASSTGAFNQGFKSNIMSGLSNGNRQPPDTHSNGWDRV